MLKYVQKFGNIKTRPIFATVLIQTEYRQSAKAIYIKTLMRYQKL